MKEKIEELIVHHQNSKKEVDILLEELYQIDLTKLSDKDVQELECSKIALDTERGMRVLFITELQDLL